MRFVLFFIALFVSNFTLASGLGTKNPFPTLGACIAIWFVYYLITLPGRRRRQYWRERRQLEDQYMRAYLRNNKFH